MIETVNQDRNSNLEEYLQLLRLMAFELDRAMQAIVQNSLTALEDSVGNQQAFSARLGELADNLGNSGKKRTLSSSSFIEGGLKDQILSASDTLEKLNRRYSSLLKHSSRSVALMVSLFSSFQGQMQEDSGPRLKLHTWSARFSHYGWIEHFVIHRRAGAGNRTGRPQRYE